MSKDSSDAYARRREAEELLLAVSATDPAAREAHYALAERYRAQHDRTALLGAAATRTRTKLKQADGR